MSVEARGGYHYFLTFTEDLCRYGYIYLMKHKSETFEKFKELESEMENHRNKKIKFPWYDHRGEYLSYEFGLHLNNVELFHKSRHLEHHSVMVCPNIVTILY